MSNDDVCTISGRMVSELSMEDVLAGELTVEDFRIRAETRPSSPAFPTSRCLRSTIPCDPDALAKASSWHGPIVWRPSTGHL
jgi:hypothetical protein